MPIFQAGAGQAPSWCELECFEWITVTSATPRTLRKHSRQEELVVCRGPVVVSLEGAEITLPEGGKLDLHAAGPCACTAQVSSGEALLCRLQGRWKSVTGSGLFSVAPAAVPTHDTPYPYRKTTGFDNHYHDCDEYWLVFEGTATVASEGKLYEVKPGDCVATGMGWHHDVVAVTGQQPLRAVWFEGTLEGARRVGHLWEPNHGPAVPAARRV